MVHFKNLSCIVLNSCFFKQKIVKINLEVFFPYYKHLGIVIVSYRYFFIVYLLIKYSWEIFDFKINFLIKCD